MADITTLLQERHNIDPTVGNDFTITSLQDLTNAFTQTANNITLLLGAIAAISLLVGGIGVMNIMLVSVLERTREIGIRKALGARERDIWIQFLIEAASLTFTGGIIGVIIGWGGSYLVSHFSSISTLVSANIVILAVSVSIGIGLFFGFYPAWNASRLDPIQALRSE
jgi:putative ABC transport system permease protein